MKKKKRNDQETVSFSYLQPFDAPAIVNQQQEQDQPSFSSASLRYRHLRAHYILGDRHSFHWLVHQYLWSINYSPIVQQFDTHALSGTTAFLSMIGRSFHVQSRYLRRIHSLTEYSQAPLPPCDN